MKKVAVILFNLGGPDHLGAVEPFLFNLFNDPAIINYPQPFRWLLAKLISYKRAPLAQNIYKELGGKSPLLDNTIAQANAIEDKFDNKYDLKCWPVMRYWHPFANAVVGEVNNFQPDEIILLPLYPQYSTTTTGSSLLDWQKSCKSGGLSVPTTLIGCYPENDGFCGSVAKLINQQLDEFKGDVAPRVLFSAHGLPQKIVDAGDPYQNQIEKTAISIAKKLDLNNLDWRVCYQSRVGRLEWIKPYIEDEIKQAGVDQVPLIIVPIAFVSEHSETLVELDIEYRELAEEHKVPAYIRIPTVGIERDFIDGLANLIEASLSSKSDIFSENDIPKCYQNFNKCICQAPQG